MFVRNLTVILVMILLTSCAEPVAKIAETPSGRPEALFVPVSASTVSQRLTSLCLEKGWLVQVNTTAQVKCGGQMTGEDALLAQFVIGNSYSTTPELYVQFVIVKTDAGIRVQAQQWIETQMAFGQINRAELNAGRQFNSIQELLYKIGGKPV